MREILFRGKKSSTGEWVAGSLIVNKNGLHTITQVMENPVSHGELNGWCYGVIPETVGQFTGLVDKNGVKIFEGDILERVDVSSTHLVIWESDRYLVKEIYDSWLKQNVFYKNSCSSLSSMTTFKIEIIGNIHDNPELKGGQHE